MILADDVPYPRQYVHVNSNHADPDSKHFGFVVPYPGAPAYWIWWREARASWDITEEQAKARVAAGHLMVRTYEYPDWILPKYRAPQGDGHDSV